MPPMREHAWLSTRSRNRTITGQTSQKRGRLSSTPAAVEKRQYAAAQSRLDSLPVMPLPKIQTRVEGDDAGAPGIIDL